MDLDNGIILETLQTQLIILMVKVTRIVGDFLSEHNPLTEMVEAGKEVTTPTHETETGKVIGAPLALRKAREETPSLQLKFPATSHARQSLYFSEPA